VRYIVKYGFFDARLFPRCELCGGANSRTHVTNDCKFFEKQRNEALMKISKTLVHGRDKTGRDLEKWIMKLYFDPDPTWTPKQMRELIMMIKEFISSIYMDRKKKNEDMSRNDDFDNEE